MGSKRPITLPDGVDMTPQTHRAPLRRGPCSRPTEPNREDLVWWSWPDARSLPETSFTRQPLRQRGAGSSSSARPRTRRVDDGARRWNRGLASDSPNGVRCPERRPRAQPQLILKYGYLSRSQTVRHPIRTNRLSCEIEASVLSSLGDLREDGGFACGPQGRSAEVRSHPFVTDALRANDREVPGATSCLRSRQSHTSRAACRNSRIRRVYQRSDRESSVPLPPHRGLPLAKRLPEAGRHLQGDAHPLSPARPRTWEGS